MKKLAAIAFLATQVAWGQAARQWQALARDGIHDPKNPALRLLQEPAEALSRLPPVRREDLSEAQQKAYDNLTAPREGRRVMPSAARRG